MASDHNPDQTLTGIFKLPPELRNKIYGYYFQDDFDTDVDLRQIYRSPQILPYSSNITLVCRQLHVETQGLCSTARLAFLPRYNCYIDVDAMATEDEIERDVTTFVSGGEGIPPSLSQFSFKVKWIEGHASRALSAGSHYMITRLWEGHAICADGSLSGEATDWLLAHLTRAGLRSARPDYKHNVSWQLTCGGKLNVARCVGLVYEGCDWVREETMVGVVMQLNECAKRPKTTSMVVKDMRGEAETVAADVQEAESRRLKAED